MALRPPLVVGRVAPHADPIRLAWVLAIPVSRVDGANAITATERYPIQFLNHVGGRLQVLKGNECKATRSFRVFFRDQTNTLKG